MIWGDCGRAKKWPCWRREGTRKSRAPSGVDLMSVGVSISVKAALGEEPAHEEDDFVAQADDLGDAGAAQVDVAVAEPHKLVDLALVVHGEGGREGLVQDLDARGEDLDLARGHVTVDGLGRAAADRPLDGEHPLGAGSMGGLVGLGVLRVDDDLDNAVRVAEVEEDEAAVVAAAVDPAGEAHGAALVGDGQVTGIGVFEHESSLPRGGFQRPTRGVQGKGSAGRAARPRRRPRCLARRAPGSAGTRPRGLPHRG